MSTSKKTMGFNVPFFMATPTVVWQILFLCIPVILIIGTSFIQPALDSFWGYQLTLNNYRIIFTLSHLIILLRSLFLATFTTLACLLCAYPVAYYLVFKLRAMRNIGLFFLVLPFWTNLLVLVYSWFSLLEKYGFLNRLFMHVGLITRPLHLLNTPLAILIGMVYCYVPFMILPLYTHLEKFDVRLVDASSDLGATWWQTFKRIILPLSLPGIQTGFFLVYILSFGDFVIPLLLGGSKQMVAGSLISHYFLVGRNIYVGAAFTCITGLTLGVVSLVVYYIFSLKIKTVSGLVDVTHEQLG